MALVLGYKASAEQFAPRELLEFGVLAEEYGFDSVVVSDHFTPWRNKDGHAPFSFAWLAALGERTKRVRLGTSVVTPTFRYHPSVVAQATATLAVLNPARFFLGVGTGEPMNEVPALGIEFPPYRERVARLREAVELMRKLWTGEFVTYEGRYYRTKEARLFDVPPEGVPLYVAGTGEKTAEFAGSVADGFICTSGKPRELYAETLLPALDRGARKAGRNPGRLARAIEMKVSFDHDPEHALRDTRNWAALALPPEERAAIHDPREMEAKASAIADQAHIRWIVSSVAEEHVERVKMYIDLGFDHLIFHFPGEDQARTMRQYAKEILPRLRSYAGRR